MSKQVNIVNTPLHGDTIIEENGIATERLQAFFDEIEKFGTIEDEWDDLRFPAFALRIDSAATRYSYDTDELGVSFHANSRNNEEQLGAVVQMPHAWAEGQTVRPHIHWIQEQIAEPNWLLLYRIYNNGDLVPSVWASVIALTGVFTYPGSGSMVQISAFPEIVMDSITISGFIDCKIYRDTTNVSGLFAGADPVGTPVLLKEFDIHYQLDSRGSSQEFIK